MSKPQDERGVRRSEITRTVRYACYMQGIDDVEWVIDMVLDQVEAAIRNDPRFPRLTPREFDLFAADIRRDCRRRGNAEAGRDRDRLAEEIADELTEDKDEDDGADKNRRA